MSLLVFLAALLTVQQAQSPPQRAQLVQLQRIWERDPHSAFTDLIRWNDSFVCSFRVGQRHVSPDGKLQLLISKDGHQWRPLARIESPDADLRDPKLAVGPKGELLVLSAGALHDPRNMTHQTYLWSSPDGKKWSERSVVGEPDSWLWRVTPHEGRCWGWGYGTNKARFIRLYAGRPGELFEPITGRLLQEKGYPNEAAMVMEGRRATVVVRRDGAGAPSTGLLGIASAPFQEWTWRDLGTRIGGPALLRLPSGELLTAVRLYSPSVRTALCLVDEHKPGLVELLTLPSGGDCSYAGMVWHGNHLWVSYYSSHEGKSTIYLATIQIQKP
jgi:hypothetical protein